jgi:hypothetical protein
MKRTEALRLIANSLDFLNLSEADTILTTLEQSGLLTPTHKTTVTRRDIELMPYEDTVIVEGWENE